MKTSKQPVQFLPGTFFRRYLLLILCIFIQSVATAQRLGLHVTQQELDIWIQRKNSTATLNTTNYRTAGDVQTNSPGDWDRIVSRTLLSSSHTDAFMKDPDKYRWTGPTGTGCKTIATTGLIDDKSNVSLLNAAFYAMLTQDATVRQAVINEIVAQAQEPGVQFSDGTWCANKVDSNVALEISYWITRLLFAYDYTKEHFTPAQRAIVDAWLLSFADLAFNNIDLALDEVFTNWEAENYVLTGYGELLNNENNNTPNITHFGGYKAWNVHKLFNNRRMSQVRAMALIAIFLNNTNYKEKAKILFRAWCKFGIYPDNSSAEYYKWAESKPDLGMHYSTTILGTMAQIADAFARIGDPSLYNYTTSDGYRESVGGNKGLKGAIIFQSEILSKRVVRYGTAIATDATGPNKLMDGIMLSIYGNDLNNWYILDDVILSHPNLYYKDNIIKNMYLRKDSPGYDYEPYPANPAPNGPALAYQGEWGTMPGSLFMFGQMENLVNPYQQVNITAPVNNASFVIGSSIIINATASNPVPNGSVSKVEFYQGTTKLGEDLISPYSYTWNNVTAGTYQLTAKVFDNNNLPLLSSPITITVNGIASGTDYRVNAGGTFVSDTPLNWEASTISNNGTYVNNTSISTGTFTGTNTTGAPNEIFNTYRVDYGAVGDPLTSEMRWAFPVSTNGSYEVKLYFAELFFTQANRRKFDVFIEGSIVLNDYDIYADVAKNAVVKTFTVNVTDNILNIDFTHVVADPMVNGVAIKSLSCTASGTITRDLWTNLTGTEISSIPVATTPTSSNQLTIFETPSNVGDNYGQRIRGYICPPQTGNYTFWIASDDKSELWLSTDDNPANKVKIAYLNYFTGVREWTKYPIQMSAPIALQQGTRYYIEALHKENLYSDNLSVGWQLPDATYERPIPGNRLSPFSGSGSRIGAEDSSEEQIITYKVYPNPFKDNITVDLSKSSKGLAIISLVDVLGKVYYQTSKVISTVNGEKNVILPARELKQGVYFVKVAHEEDKQQVIRVIKQ